ncbi:MAG TPA: bifunctional 2-polyprenyl-6-hydroxyphenol methylase/3-demethylubiquinol 3-O-methyltransferase UbiG [Steroidobacteraceae bacterium]|nr:bifunctional 2-polyprenyl-6-hydroxyphenol methylase/3-demethylubiquinol 3-O-methyltransferase UbiG [Steroidobacteraceae bacterium]
MTEPNRNVDPAEIERFESAARRWWDPEGEFAPLHVINPVRVEYIAEQAQLAGARVLDVGCGGGLLTEALAARADSALGIDLGATAIEVAELHALESGSNARYRCVSAEELAAEEPGAYDVVACLEMLEHVPDPASVLKAIATLVRPGGDVVLSTISRTPKAYALAVVGAEYVLRLLPRGTHDYQRFIRPGELARWSRAAGLTPRDVRGIGYDPLRRRARLTTDTSVNYLMHLVRDDTAP